MEDQMASYAHPVVRAGESPDIKISLQRVTLYDLFQRYIPILSGLPGGSSQFDQTELGSEWHCECDIGAPCAGQNNLQMHFHLIDLEQFPKPAAVLYLVEPGHYGGQQTRLPLPLENLTETQERLNEQLTKKGANIGVFEKAGNFIAALGNVRDLLRAEVTWV